jgi:single-strand DNA-binding protein
MEKTNNKVQLSGCVGKDPEIKSFKNGKLAKFRMATHEFIKNGKGELVRETQWHSVIAWGIQAGEVEKLLHKGMEIRLEGRLVNSSFVDKNGVKRYVTDIQLVNLELLAKAVA